MSRPIDSRWGRPLPYPPHEALEHAGHDAIRDALVDLLQRYAEPPWRLVGDEPGPPSRRDVALIAAAQVKVFDAVDEARARKGGRHVR